MASACIFLRLTTTIINGSRQYCHLAIKHILIKMGANYQIVQLIIEQFDQTPTFDYGNQTNSKQ